jgi:hypothetical protein
MSNTETRRRTVRNAQLSALFEGKSFTLTAEIALPGDAVKFRTVVGARGRSGYLVTNNATGEALIVGWQTLKDAADLGALSLTAYAGEYMKPLTVGRGGTLAVVATWEALDAAMGVRHNEAPAPTPDVTEVTPEVEGQMALEV